MFRHASRFLLVLALGFAPRLASADLYRWVDELGVTHFTTNRDTIPRSFRDEAVVIGELPSPKRVPAPRAAAPVVVPPPELEAPPQISAPELVAPESELDAPETEVPALAAPAELTPARAPETETWEPAPIPEPSATSAPTVMPGPPTTNAISPDDPRASEVAQLEAQIASDREKLRQMISTKRWDSAELASDPEIREIADRLPRLQAQLAALQAEPAP